MCLVTNEAVKRQAPASDFTSNLGGQVRNPSDRDCPDQPILGYKHGDLHCCCRHLWINSSWGRRPYPAAESFKFSVVRDPKDLLEVSSQTPRLILASGV
jgi:hypothetical protein